MDVLHLIERLQRAYPEARCALAHDDPLQLLVATILSAQCTDARVNQVTPGLFARYPDAAALRDADPAELEAIVRPTGFYRNKAKAVRGAARAIMERFGGRVPRTMEELLTLPGVARKTANVVLGTAYGVGEGIAVDTHVHRLAHRLGLADGASPEEVERQLMRIVPRSEWIDFSHLLIHHGRRVCVARAPRCAICPVRDLCPSADYFLQGGKPVPLRRKAAPRRAKPKPRRAKPKARRAQPKARRRTSAPRRGRARRSSRAVTRRTGRRSGGKA